jgi:hypothetical protein
VHATAFKVALWQALFKLAQPLKCKLFLNSMENELFESQRFSFSMLHDFHLLKLVPHPPGARVADRFLLAM